MSENKCEGCPKSKTLVSGWKCCMGNSCEVDVRADERRKFARWYAQRKGFSKEWADRFIEIYEKEQKK